MITSLKIIPDFGHDGQGGYDRGMSNGPYSQLDITDIYMRYFLDSLDHYGLRHTVVPTRTKPGISLETRLQSIGVGELGVILSTGWHDKSKKRMGSQVSYHGKEGLKLAESVLDSLFEWGTCACYGHVRNYPKEDEAFRDLRSLCIRIEPFPLNAPLAKDYLLRLKALGFDLGRFFYEWVTGCNPAMLNTPQSLPKRA